MRFAAVVVALAVAMFGVQQLGTTPAFADNPIEVGDTNNNSLNDVQSACFSTGGAITSWTFVINQLDRSAPKPPITVSFDTNFDDVADSSVQVNAGPEGGPSNAHYTVSGSGIVLNATASVGDTWSGQFVLSHVTCPPRPLDACAPFTNRTVVTFDALLGDPAFPLPVQSPPVALVIGPGTYAVTLQSFDEHSTKPGQVQHQEQWFARFSLSAGGTIDSGTIADLPDALDVMNQNVGNITFAGATTQVVARHALADSGAFTSPESIIAKCVAMDPVP